MRRGANANARYRGRPVLLWAIQEGHLNVVKTLIAAGASMERRDDDGFTPLDQAAGEGNIQIVRQLLRSGANVNGRTRNGTPLHTACAYGHVAIVRLLLDSGADPSATDDAGRTPAAFTRIGKAKGQRASTIRGLFREASAQVSGAPNSHPRTP
jgi:ankyrin repeat protein